MDLIELGAVLGDFFENGHGPSHDQLDQAFARFQLTAGGLAPSGKTPQGAPLGKPKRIRQVLVHASDEDPGGSRGPARRRSCAADMGRR